MRQYLTQLRQEIGQRVVDKVYYPDDKPSKVYILLLWLHYHYYYYSVIQVIIYDYSSKWIFRKEMIMIILV